MTSRNDRASTKLAAVLIPVVIGSILGMTASLTTSYYTFRVERGETLRKERMAHLERAAGLAAKYSSDVSRLLGVGFITKGDVTSQDVAVLVAPTETLMELSVVVSLYFPQLRSDVEQLSVAHNTMMRHFDDIIGAHDEHRAEDAVAFAQRIQKEIAPAMESVRSLARKLSDIAQKSTL